MKAIEIQIYEGPKLITQGICDQSKIIIGRILSADFRIDHPTVSRIHALLERLDDLSLRITDLASSHGTFVNGERVIEKNIGPKDELRFAQLKIKIKKKRKKFRS